MTLRKQLLTSKQTTIDIISEDAQAEAHFANPANFADIVLDQINNDRFMDQIFEGEDDLTVLDIGGNIGLFTLFAQDRCKAIYPIEPTPGHFHILKELTKDYPNVHPLNLAASNENTTIDFYINEGNTTMNSLANKYGTKVEVEARTIKTIINDLGLDHVDFVKCDIEGSEMVALTAETVGEVAELVDCWFIEVHATNDPKTGDDWAVGIESNRRKLAGIFEDAGYEVQDYRHDGLYICKA
jgi:FkbM family methyltransferase